MLYFVHEKADSALRLLRRISRQRSMRHWARGRYLALPLPSPNRPLRMMLGLVPLAPDSQALRRSSTSYWRRPASRSWAERPCSAWFTRAARTRYSSILEPPE